MHTQALEVLLSGKAVPGLRFLSVSWGLPADKPKLLLYSHVGIKTRLVSS